MPRRSTARIHVNQHVIRANAKNGTRLPVLTVKRGRHNVYAMAAEVQGPCRIVYSPDAPLPCGARVWVETEAEVVLHGAATVPPVACPTGQP